MLMIVLGPESDLLPLALQPPHELALTARTNTKPTTAARSTIAPPPLARLSSRFGHRQRVGAGSCLTATIRSGAARASPSASSAANPTPAGARLRRYQSFLSARRLWRSPVERRHP